MDGVTLTLGELGLGGHLVEVVRLVSEKEGYMYMNDGRHLTWD